MKKSKSKSDPSLWQRFQPSVMNHLNTSDLNLSSSDNIEELCPSFYTLETPGIVLLIFNVVFASAAFGFTVFLAYLTIREALAVKHNLRVMSQIERDSFSVPSRRRSSGIMLEPRRSVDGTRASFDDIYETYLPQYKRNFEEEVESETDSDDLGNKGGVFVSTQSHTLWDDEEPDAKDKEVDVMKMIIFPESKEAVIHQHEMPSVKSTQRSNSAVAVERVMKTLHKARHSLYSTSSLAEAESKSSLYSLNTSGAPPPTTIHQTRPLPQTHHSVTSLYELQGFRKTSIPMPMRNRQSGILRRDSRPQSELERMKQRRPGVSFNSGLPDKVPRIPHLVMEPVSTDL